MNKPEMEEAANRMYDILAGAPNGTQRDDLMTQVGIPDVGTFHEIKGILQDMLGGGDVINVVGDSAGGRDGGWTYSLQGDPSHPIPRSYLVSKMRNLLGREKRAYWVQKALVQGTNARTRDGRTARYVLDSMLRKIRDTERALDELGIVVEPFTA